MVQSEMNEQDYAARLMQQRMLRTNGSIPAGAPPPRKRVHFNPNVEMGPSGVPMPTRPRLPITDRVTESGPKIPRDLDPTKKYHNLKPAKENSTGAPNENDKTAPSYFSQSLELVAAIFLIASVFVIPNNFKIFWLIIAGTSPSN